MFWYFYGVVVTLAHLPLVFDCLRFAFPRLKLSRVGNGSKYLMLVLGAIVMVTILWQLSVFLPLYIPDPFHSIAGVLHITFAMWMWINVFVNYFRALLTPPGEDKSQGPTPPVTSVRPPGENSSQFPNSDIRARTVEQLNGRPTEEMKDLPFKQSVPKDGMHWSPSRGNYCKLCGYKVAFVDHHCPYIGRCFGLHNYSYFYLGVLYGLLGGVYALALTAHCFWECDVKYLLAYLNIVDSATLETDMCVQIGTQSRAVIAVMFGLWMVGMMFLAQNILLLADISTFDFLKNSAKLPLARFIGERIRGRKFLESNSRLNVLILSQRAKWYHFLIPVRNTQPSLSHSLVQSV